MYTIMHYVWILLQLINYSVNYNFFIHHDWHTCGKSHGPLSINYKPLRHAMYGK